MKFYKINYLCFLCITMLSFNCSNDDDNDSMGPPPAVVVPTANITYDINALISGQSVTFSDNSVAGSSSITSWNWTFQGGTPNSSTEQNPTVVFNTIGEFSATLTVTTNDGTDTATENFVVINGCTLYDCEKFPVMVQSNVSYGVTTEHLMNIYLPISNISFTKPAILINGGGAYNGSDLSLIEELAERLSSYGFVVATARYRNGIGNATANLLRGMVDSRAAVRYLRANTTSFDVNPNQIYTGGWSSGAYNALIHAYWQEADVPADLLNGVITAGFIDSWEGDQGNSGISSDVLGVINLGGSIFGMDEDFQDDLWITASDVPMFAVHGELDDITPCGVEELETGNWEFGSCIINDRLQALGIQSEFIQITNGDHESPRMSENIDNYLPLLVAFVNDNL